MTDFSKFWRDETLYDWMLRNVREAGDRVAVTDVDNLADGMKVTTQQADAATRGRQGAATQEPAAGADGRE